MKLPNILFILIDDLGFGDVGFTQSPSTSTTTYTPNIDALASSGVILDRHYAYKTCTPSRSSLQSGRLPVHVTEQLKVPDDPTAGVPYNYTTVSEVLTAHSNYTSHFVGKWDAGMATTRHTPLGRGYSNSSLSYFSHKNEFFDHTTLQSGCQTKCETEGAGDRDCIVDLWEGDHPAALPTGDFVEFVFRDRALEIIGDEAATANPWFLVYSSHIAHCPLQVPEDKMDAFIGLGDDESMCSAQTLRINPVFDDGNKFECRATYSAMVNTLDDVVGDLKKALVDTNQYNDTLIIFTSDNGGCVKLEESGGNNYPLRGGKYSDLEGGVRTAAFAGGGWLESKVKGGTRNGEIFHIADWYSTVASIAGVSAENLVDTRAQAANLPPLDSKDQTGSLLNGEASPWTDVPLILSSNAVILNEHKLIVQKTVSPAGHPGPVYPNASSNLLPVDDPALNLDCSSGCLFDVMESKSEHTDLSSNSTYADKLADMKNILEMAKDTFYENSEVLRTCDGVDIGDAVNCGCWTAYNVWGGTFGPYAVGGE
jgi:arylsulfatase I/J